MNVMCVTAGGTGGSVQRMPEAGVRRRESSLHMNLVSQPYTEECTVELEVSVSRSARTVDERAGLRNGGSFRVLFECLKD